MKYFALIVFLFLSVFTNAQMTLEEISYIPSHSGYYNNLVVKGNTNIKEILTFPFNVVSYASLLKVNVAETSKMSIGTISVSTGTVFLDSKYSVDDVSNWELIDPNVVESRSTGSVNLTMDGGNLSTRSKNSNGYVQINSITFGASGSKSPNLNIRTENLNHESNSLHPATDNLYIFGMKIPQCPNGYYWQPVKVSGTFYYILACNTTSCSNPEYEEACLQKNAITREGTGSTKMYIWNTKSAPNCKCEKNGVEVHIDSPIDF